MTFKYQNSVLCGVYLIFHFQTVLLCCDSREVISAVNQIKIDKYTSLPQVRQEEMETITMWHRVNNLLSVQELQKEVLCPWSIFLKTYNLYKKTKPRTKTAAAVITTDLVANEKK